MKIIEVLRLTALGYSQRDIAADSGVSRATVGNIQSRCNEIQLTYDKARDLDMSAINELVYPDHSKPKYIKEEPDFEYVYNEMLKHKHLNLRFLWDEYKSRFPDGLEYSQFCNRYNKWKEASFKNLSMHQEQKPGEKMFVDWMGDTFKGIVDPTTGEVIEAHIFVATLGFSGMPYAEAFPNEKLDNWLMAHRHALEFYEGAPKIIVPDNCKTAVQKTSLYNPNFNPVFFDFAQHYSVAIIPARVKKPQDKAIVEQNVRWLETWLLGKFRNQTFFSFEPFNQAIREELKSLSFREYQKREGTRYAAFHQIDKPALTSLPSTPFEHADAIYKLVPDNYHVQYDKHYYSVPYQYYKSKVLIRATANTIEIFDLNRIRIASHNRVYSGKKYHTTFLHMPKNHQKYWEEKQFTGTRYLNWANSIGPNTYDVIDTLLHSNPIEEQAYKSCMGILQFAKKYSNERLEKACQRASDLKSCSYTTIKNILKNGQDQLPRLSSVTKPTPEHENIRGSDYYS